MQIYCSFDIDGAPFSPPSHDDSFFYIRYPINNGTKGTSTNTSSNNVSGTAAAPTTGTKITTSGDINTLTKALNNTLGVSTSTGNATSGAGKQTVVAAAATTAAHHGQQHIDFSKHTEPCKKFISGINNGKCFCFL